MPGRVVNIGSGNATPGPQVTSLQERPVPALRRSTQVPQLSDPDKLLPGVVGKEDGQVTPRGHGNSYLTSTTQMDNGTDAVLQQGAEVRRRHIIMSNNVTSPYRSPGQPTKPVSTVRPQSAMAVSSPSHVYNGGTFAERPPSSLGVAWGSSQKFFNGSNSVMDGIGQPSSSGASSSLEARLMSLMNDGSPSQQHRGHAMNGQMPYDDNEIILPVHQRSRSYGDGVTSGQGHNGAHYSGGNGRIDDIYAVVAKRPNRGVNGETSSGYVPSQPYERQDTTRPEPQTTVRYHGHAPGPPYTSLDGNAGGSRGQDNLAFLPESPHRGKEHKLQKGSTSSSYDLRSAWQRLYGTRPDQTSINRRPSVDDSLGHNKTSSMDDSLGFHTAAQHNTHHPSPQSIRPKTSSAAVSDSMRGPGSIPNGMMRASTDSLRNSRHSLVNNVSSKELHYGSTSALVQPQLVTGRESPTGQSSSNPEQPSESNNSSQLSSYSVTNKNLSTFKPEKSNKSNMDSTLGPASKYPENQMGGRSGNHTPVQFSGQNKHGLNHEHMRNVAGRPHVSSPQFSQGTVSPRRRRSDSASDAVEFNVIGDRTPRPPSRKGSAFLDSEDDIGDGYQLKPLDSIFDYPGADSDNDSVTPPLPPLSPSISPRGSETSTPTNMFPRFTYDVTTPKSPPRTPDLIRPPSRQGINSQSYNTKAGGLRQMEKTVQSHSYAAGAKEDSRSRGTRDGHADSYSRNSLANYARSRSLEDVRESGNESTLSFDIENTMLTVDPSDQSEMGTLRSQKSGSVKAQLNRLKDMYSHVMKTLEENTNSRSSRTQRRWSIGSSDTSSMRQHTHQSRHSRSSAHRMSSKDVKAIGKRFQRLESHVITLARSVAHLSSELRSHNTLTREIENVKREMQDLKIQGNASTFVPGHFMGSNRLSDFERNRGWVPSLTNPRRVNKLTKFFGQEPPLLKIFLERLGYEKFLKNFEDEHIGMIELPYMTEDRLQSIGIPMGPRLRIIQEAQMCFKQGNFDIYFV